MRAWPPTLLALAWLLAGMVRPAGALHYVQEGLGCYACHTLSTDEGEAGTSLINRSSRTTLDIKAANGGATPAQFGCTYCHNIGSRPRMRAVLDHFMGKASMHPVGKNFVSGADTNREYLSAWNTAFPNSWTASTATTSRGRATVGTTLRPRRTRARTETRDVAAEPGIRQQIPGARPAGLRREPVPAPQRHGAQPVRPALPRLPRQQRPAREGVEPDRQQQAPRSGDLARGRGPVASGGSGPIVEDDGTAFKSTAAGGGDQCRSCHDTHYSSRQVLFNDGHEHVSGTPARERRSTPAPTAPRPATIPATPPATPGGGGPEHLHRHGHGRPTSSTGATLNFGCGNCHTVNARHDSPFTRRARLPHALRRAGPRDLDLRQVAALDLPTLPQRQARPRPRGRERRLHRLPR